MDATQMELLGRAVRGLEHNLGLIDTALGFVAGLDDGEFTEYHYQLDYIDNALTVYFHFQGDLARLKQVIADLRMKAPTGPFGGDPMLPLPGFQSEADRTLRAFDAQLNLTCDLLRLNPLTRDVGDGSGSFPTVAQWGKYEKRNLDQVRNIIWVARSLLED